MKCLQACRGFCSVNAHSSAWGVNFNAWGRQTGSQGPGEVVHPGQEGWGKSTGGSGESRVAPTHLAVAWSREPEEGPSAWPGNRGRAGGRRNCLHIIPKVGGEARILEDCSLHPDAPAPGSLVLTPNSARPPSARPVQARGPGQAARAQAQPRGAPKRRHGGGADVGGPRPRVRGEGAGAWAGRGREDTPHPRRGDQGCDGPDWPPASWASLWREGNGHHLAEDMGCSSGTRRSSPPWSGELGWRRH